VNRPGLVQPADYRQVMSTGVGITLVMAGAILRFAVPATFIHGLNVHVIGVIVMLAGVLGLLLSLLVWGPLSRRRTHSGGYGHGRRRSPGSRASTGTSYQRGARRRWSAVTGPWSRRASSDIGTALSRLKTWYRWATSAWSLR